MNNEIRNASFECNLGIIPDSKYRFVGEEILTGFNYYRENDMYIGYSQATRNFRIATKGNINEHDFQTIKNSLWDCV